LDPDQAKINVTKLSGLLRKSLILGKEQLVTLEEELAIVNDYLDLEKVRFEERVTIFQEHDQSLLNRQIPPFILQTLVENAIKHGVSKRIEGSTIWIRSYMDYDVAKLEVSNEGNLEHNEDAGIGIANTMRRLELQYRGKAHFELFEKDGIVHAVITIKEI
jgi:LytS/YehU family sensor histidine kinase